MTSALHQRIRRTIRRYGLIPRGGRVVIGLSGGSDSVALALLLKDLATHGEFVIASLAHLNHQLRGTADRDEHFCRELAQRHQLPIAIARKDVRQLAASARLSLEDAARRARYEFLDQVAVNADAQLIAVGHTQDDQAETFLMKLMRGAGLAGLAGVYPRRGAVIRPLLETSRAELRSFLVERQEQWVEDETNADIANPRNRIRHSVLPELDRALGGESRPNLARAASLAREDGEWLDQLADEQFPAVMRESGDGLELNADAVGRLAPPLARRVALRALRQIAGGREVGQDHVEAVLALIAGNSGGIDVPGGRVEPKAGKLVLIQQKAGSK